jgi:hypothetical protein
MNLHHFTSFPAAQAILAAEALRPRRWTFAPKAAPVVWFTADADRETVYTGWHDEPIAVLARAIRFTVDVPDAEVSHWRDWLARSGRGVPLAQCDPEVAAYKARWFVMERAVPNSEWVAWDWAVSAEQFAAAIEGVSGP